MDVEEHKNTFNIVVWKLPFFDRYSCSLSSVEEKGSPNCNAGVALKLKYCLVFLFIGGKIVKKGSARVYMLYMK